MASDRAASNPLGDRCDGLGQVGAAARLRVRGWRRTGNRRDGIVGGDEEVRGPAFRPRCGDESLHLVGAVVGGDHRRDARRLRRDVREVLELPVAERVVDDLADPLLAHRRHTDDMEDAGPLGLGPHHAVERGQLADGIGGQEHRTTPHAGIAVGRVRRVQLVGTSNPADRLAPRDRVAELECEVTRDSEAVGDPLACEPPDEVIRDSRLLTHRMSSENGKGSSYRGRMLAGRCCQFRSSHSGFLLEPVLVTLPPYC